MALAKQRRLRRRRIKDDLDAFKLSVGCQHCGYKKNAVALDFHHVDGQKDSSISKLANSESGKKVWIEVGKCMVLCANCHRIEHLSD